jgi:hypothetical protein
MNTDAHEYQNRFIIYVCLCPFVVNKKNKNALRFVTNERRNANYFALSP